MTKEYREYAKSRIEYLLKISGFVFDERDKEALEVAIQALSQEPKCPCDVCMYNPPSSTDGKPCTMCPAEKGGD